MEPDFRHALRHETRRDHDHLDRLISTLDVADRGGFQSFLQLHLSCFLVMQSRLSDGCRCREMLGQMVCDLKNDLNAISADPRITQAELPMDIDPLAIDYIVAGSRLGTMVLCKEWARSTDPVVRRANGYFGRINDASLWHETCHALTDVPIHGARASVIVSETRLLFKLFSEVFDALVLKQDMTS